MKPCLHRAASSPHVDLSAFQRSSDKFSLHSSAFTQKQQLVHTGLRSKSAGELHLPLSSMPSDQVLPMQRPS